MLIAHFPMGYLLGKVASRISQAKASYLILASILGNMLPDFDMLYFHFIDGRKTHHHDYFTHWPLFWAGVSIILLSVAWFGKRTLFPVALLICLGTLAHMVMDTVAAPIHWFAPFSPKTFEMVQVPAIHSNWIISFMLHWTFLIEIGICLLAALVYVSNRKSFK